MAGNFLFKRLLDEIPLLKGRQMNKVMLRREVSRSISMRSHYWECLLCPPRTEVFHFLDICLAHLETKHGITVCQINLKDGCIRRV